MKYSPLKVIGWILFTLSVVTFISLSFVIDLSFKEKDLKSLFEEKNASLAESMKQVPDQPAYSIIGDIKKKFSEYDQTVISLKGITGEKRELFFERLRKDPSYYDEDYISSQYGDNQFISDKLKEYTGWMIGRDWSSWEEFENVLNQKVDGVNQAVAAHYGLSPDMHGQLYQDLMLKASPDYLKTGLWAWLIFGIAFLGAIIHFIPLMSKKPGIHNNHIYHNKSQTRHWPAIIVFACLVGFYIILYRFPHFAAPQISLLKPLSEKMAGVAANQWFLYGFLYTLSMGTMGLRMFIKYRGNAYQQIRTCSVFFFQLCFAFTLPQILTLLQKPAYDIKSAWPLEYNFFFDYRVDEYFQAGTLGIYLFVWGIALFAIGVPLLTYFYGKRWYCSWICGCGGLAETVGDPYRHLSDKSLSAWKVERWTVHSGLVFAVIMTIAVLYTTITGNPEVLGVNSYSLRSSYGFIMGFVFAGAVGTGFYPIMGNRVWCRFGCPLAAYLGIVQRFKSRFRITTNGGQCISCGNCSTYCEMGIDVRAYAQRGQNIVRASCVGCGVCSAVCPRGVLKLENKSGSNRINENPILIGQEGATLNLQ